MDEAAFKKTHLYRTYSRYDVTDLHTRQCRVRSNDLIDGVPRIGCGEVLVGSSLYKLMAAKKHVLNYDIEMWYSIQTDHLSKTLDDNCYVTNVPMDFMFLCIDLMERTAEWIRQRVEPTLDEIRNVSAPQLFEGRLVKRWCRTL
jgi:hypothetical protein